MENGMCIAGWVFKGRYGKLTADIYAVVEFFVHYLFHMVAFTIFYGRVIQTSKKVQEDEKTRRYDVRKHTEGNKHFGPFVSVLAKEITISGVEIILTFERIVFQRFAQNLNSNCKRIEKSVFSYYF